MTIKEIYQYCEDLANKDQKGNAFGPDQFNNTMNFVSLELFQGFFKMAQEVAVEKGVPLSEVIFSMNDLRTFIAIVSIPSVNVFPIDNTFVSVVAPYPANYRYWLSLMANNVPVEIRPYSEISNYRGGMLNVNPDEHPLAFEGGGGFEIIPNDLQKISMTYLRKPAVPFYDFCTTSDDLKIFMPVGSKIRYLGPTDYFVLYDKNGDVICLDVYKEGIANPSDTYLSRTVELDWTDTMHPDIAMSVLEKMGINLREPGIVQWTQSKSK